MRLYVGSTKSREMVAALREQDVGRMNNPEGVFRPYDGEKWAADNGAYGLWMKGRPFNGDAFLRYLDRLLKFDSAPRFAVLPDRVAEGLWSLEFSAGWIGKVPAGWPWYLAVQDGMTVPDVEPYADQIAGLFVGGTLRFKSTAPAWTSLGKRVGLPVHFGRAGPLNRIEFAYRMGCESSDSTKPIRCWDNLWEFLPHVKDGHYDPDTYRQGKLFAEAP